MSTDAVKRTRSGLITQAAEMRQGIERKLTAKKLDPNAPALEEDDDAPVLVEEHLHEMDWVCEKWETDLKKGLETSKLEKLREKHGFNELKPPPTVPWYWNFFGHMTGFFSLLLWLASFLCFVAYLLDSTQIDYLYLGIVLAVVVFATGCFSYAQDAKSAAVMAGFKNMIPSYCSVVRDGKPVDIPARELLPGDIVRLTNGNKVPADIRIFESKDIKVDNSSLTGESVPLRRTGQISEHEDPLEAANLCFFGTKIMNGNGSGVVIGTGDKTVIGTVAMLASTQTADDTPIAKEIHHFILIVSAVAVFLGVTFVILGFIIGLGAIDNLVFGIGIIVANVPEGLLATVTVSLTLTSQRMARKNVLVKNLEAVETLGSTTVIASDKTGTLTMNQMAVQHLYYDQKTYLATDKGDLALNTSSPTYERLRLVATLCNNATFKPDEENMKLAIMQRNTNGDASESAFIKFCEQKWNKENTTILEVREEYKKIFEVPFNSANKYQISIHLNKGQNWDAPRLLMMKGAPERIWNRCDFIMIDGKKVPITEEITAAFDASTTALMQQGERVLGCCTADLSPEEFPQDYEYDQDTMNFPSEKGQGLVFCGLLALIDPPRPDVPGAVLDCQTAGIKVIMVTGDHPETAEAIAKMVNIVRDPTRRDIANQRGVSMEEVKEDDPEIEAMVVAGPDLAKMDDDQLDSILEYDQIVFARTSPAQKLRIVQGLQNKKPVRRGAPEGQPIKVKHVVAVTGDGVNDSPALKRADIGVAMGKTGSEVARDAADMILLDDSFASIVEGVLEGRLIFDNLKKSIAYTLSSNIPEITPFLLFMMIQLPLPLSTVLILCIDLGTDMVPAISLAYENKEANIMMKPPRDMNVDRLVTAKLVSFSYLQIGVFQAMAGFYTYFVVMNDYGFDPTMLPGRQAEFLNENIRTEDGISYLQDGDTFYQLKDCNINNPEVCHVPEEALAHAQCAFFISIIVVQWADIIACKTRELSLRTQGMRNSMLNWGLLSETVLGCILCYVPQLNPVFGTRPIHFTHWLPALPFSMLILGYDETRKYLMRNLGKTNWLRTFTYY